jgi:hypothetical protein
MDIAAAFVINAGNALQANQRRVSDKILLGLYMGMQPVDVLGKPSLDRRHRRVVAGLAQLGEIRLRERLGTCPSRLRGRRCIRASPVPADRPDRARLRPGLCGSRCRSHATSLKLCARHRAESLKMPDFSGWSRKNRLTLATVAAEDEIAHLAAVRVACEPFEQLDLAVGAGTG